MCVRHFGTEPVVNAVEQIPWLGEKLGPALGDMDPKWRNILVTIGVCEITDPLRMPITAALTPVVAARMKKK